MKTVAYLHGLAGSHRSFNYLLRELPAHTKVCINYASHQPLQRSYDHIVKLLPRDRPITLVGHSLGGVLSLLIAARRQIHVERVITMSSPVGGSRAAGFLRWVPGRPDVVNDLVPTSRFICEVQDAGLNIPVLNLISTAGQVGASLEPNDGVVSLRSQRSLPYGEKLEVRANHFEILSHEASVQIIRNQIFGGAHDSVESRQAA